jgi:hypothetical protein
VLQKFFRFFLASAFFFGGVIFEVPAEKGNLK